MNPQNPCGGLLVALEKDKGKYREHPKGSYGVVRGFERLANGTKTLVRLSTICPVDICPICHNVVKLNKCKCDVKRSARCQKKK